MGIVRDLCCDASRADERAERQEQGRWSPSMRSVGKEEKDEEERLSCFCVARWLSIKDCERIFSKRRKHHAK